MIAENSNQQAICCEDDGENKKHCKICEKIFIEQFYEVHLNSSTQSTNNREIRQLKNNKCMW